MPVTILIVDDSKLARIVAGKAVAELQPEWQKLEASSEQDGLELAREIRALRPDMPIAIITANIQDEIIAQAREVGAAFIPKPVTSEGLAGFLSGAALKLRSSQG
jgi:CheY-like chemotaxis protein